MDGFNKRNNNIKNENDGFRNNYENKKYCECIKKYNNKSKNENYGFNNNIHNKHKNDGFKIKT